MAKPQYCLSKTQGALTALSLAFSLSACAPPTNVASELSSYETPIQQLVEDSGVLIEFDLFYSKDTNLGHSISGSGDKNTAMHLPIKVALLQEAAKYPSAFIPFFLKRIQVTEILAVNGDTDNYAIAGTYTTSDGLVAIDSKAILESDRDRRASPPKDDQVNFLHLCTLFHHEASSLLIYNSKSGFLESWIKTFPPEEFDRVIWYNSFGDDFEYDPELQSGGFLRVYGATAPENDINTHFEFLFCHQEWYAQLILEHPVIAQKYQLIKSWLLDVDPEYKKVFKPVDRYIERGKEWGWQDYTDRNLFP